MIMLKKYIAALLGFTALAAAPANAGSIAITNVRIIDGNGAARLGRRFADLTFLDNPLIADTTPKSALEGLRKQYQGLSAEQLAAKSTYTNSVDFKGAQSNVPR
jgi:hypothetical protein